MEYNKELEKKTGIFVWENAISDRLCIDTIEAFEASPNKFNGKTGGGYSPGIKNSLDWHIDNENINSKYFKILEIALSQIKSRYFNLKGIPIFWAGLQMQKSFKGQGFFKPHTDNDERNLNEARFLAPIFYLNDVLEGGETKFPFQEIEIKPKAGTLVIFPSTWCYFHEGVKPISNDKYIITTFGLTPRN